jgi:hypothetical protein
MSHEFAFYTRIGASLFPVQANKLPLSGYKWTDPENNSTLPVKWQEWLGAGHALALNAGLSDIIVVDIDAKGDRDEAWRLWAELCAEWGIPVAAPAWQTPSGGWHVLFRAPQDVTLRQPDALKGRINVRAGHGYVLCPPSAGYMPLQGAAVHDAPAALLKHCTGRAIEREAPRPGRYDRDSTAAMLTWMAEAGAFDA